MRLILLGLMLAILSMNPVSAERLRIATSNIGAENGVGAVARQDADYRALGREIAC